LADKSVNVCISSPPYFGLRNYNADGQIGVESSPEQYVSRLTDVFREVKRVLRDDGTLWLNLGDTYCGGGRGCDTEKQRSNKGTRDMPKSTIPSGMKPKDLMGIPWMVAFALRADGWYLRQDIIWHKTNAMPESVTDRCTRSHEYIFLLSKSKNYYFDHDVIKEPCVNGDPTSPRGSRGTLTPNKGRRDNAIVDTTEPLQYRNKRDVWTISNKPFRGAHFATFPPDLVQPCILAGSPIGGVVLDPFFGSGTVGVVAKQEGRDFIGIDINKDYCNLARIRIYGDSDEKIV
jgi:DNA modification methylase